MADRRVTLTLDLDISRALADVGRVESALAGAGSRASAKASIGDSIAREAQKAAREVEKINNQTVRNTEQNDRLLERSAKTLADVQIREAKRGATAFIAEIEKTRNAEKEATSGGFLSSAFGGAFAGGAIGAVAGSVLSLVGQLPSQAESAAGSVLSLVGQLPSQAESAAFAVFNLTKAASDYGSTIKDAQDKTGLSVETLQGLRIAAQTSGSSYEAVTGAVSKFARVVGEANNGNTTAIASLARFGLTGKTASADLDGSLSKVFATIQKLPPGISQITAAQAAFGKSGAELVPVIKSFDGDLDGLKKRASELGIVLSDEAVTAADDFGDTLDIVKIQAESVAAKFALEFAPIITKSLVDVSNFLGRNADSFQRYGKTIGNIFSGIEQIATSQQTSELIKYASGVAEVANNYNGLNFVLDQTLGRLIALGKSQAEANNPANSALTAAFGDIDFNKLGAAVIALPDVSEELGLKTAEEQAKALKGEIEGITQNLALQKAQFAATQSGNPTASALFGISQNAKLENDALEAQSLKIREARTAQIKALSDEEVHAGRADEIQRAAAPEIYKLINQQAILRLNTEKAINDEIRKQSVAALDTYKNLLVASNPDNPFVKIFQDGTTALAKLRADLRDFSPEVVKQFTDLQKKVNFRNLFTAQLDEKLAAFDLRDQAANFRNPKKADYFFDPANSIQNSFTTVRQGADLSTFNRTIINDELNRPQPTLERQLNIIGDPIIALAARLRQEDPNKTLQERLSKQFDIINAQVNSTNKDPNALAVADDRFISLTSGVDPNSLTREQRDVAAGARERKAERLDANEKQAQALQIDQTAAAKSLAADMRSVLGLFTTGKAKVDIGETGQIEIHYQDGTTGNITPENNPTPAPQPLTQ